jgi:hypothetical protein
MPKAKYLVDRKTRILRYINIVKSLLFLQHQFASLELQMRRLGQLIKEGSFQCAVSIGNIKHQSYIFGLKQS